MNDLSKSLKILVERYPGTMAELARQAQIDRSSLYKIMDGKRMPNRAQHSCPGPERPPGRAPDHPIRRTAQRRPGPPYR